MRAGAIQSAIQMSISLKKWRHQNFVVVVGNAATLLVLFKADLGGHNNNQSASKIIISFLYIEHWLRHSIGTMNNCSANSVVQTPRETDDLTFQINRNISLRTFTVARLITK